MNERKKEESTEKGGGSMNGMTPVLQFIKENSFLGKIAVAVIPAALCLMAYCLQCLELQFWKISPDTIGVFGDGKYFYVIAIGLVYFLIITVLPLYLYPRTEKGVIDIKRMWFVWVTIVMLIVKLPKNERKELGAEMNACTSVFLKVQSRILSSLWSQIRYGMIMYLPFCLMYYIVLGLSFGTSIGMGVFCMIVILMATYFFIGKEDTRLLKFKKIRHNHKDNPDSLVNVCKDAIEEFGKDLGRPPRKISHSDILYYMINSIGASFAVFFLTAILQCLATQYRHDFWVYDGRDGYCVVVYRDIESLVLDDAEIDGENLKIYTDKQQVIDAKDVKLEYKKFKVVERIGE